MQCRYLLFLAVAPLLVAGSCVETMTGVKDADYRGCQDMTRNGMACQKWSAQTPHTHDKTGGGTGDHNQCRNPDGENTIWCYMMDTTVRNRRWEYCDPLIPGFLNTTCEKSKCQSEFSALHSLANQSKAYMCGYGRDFRDWQSLDYCCPTMRAVGMCSINQCTAPGDMNSSLGTNVDLDRYWKIAGLLCDCSAQGCVKMAELLEYVVTQVSDVAGALELLGAMNTQGHGHPLMEKVCDPTGMSCLAGKSSCEAVAALTDNNINVAMASVQGIASRHCGTTTIAPGSTTGNSEDTPAVGSANSAPIAFGLLFFLVMMMSWTG